MSREYDQQEIREKFMRQWWATVSFWRDQPNIDGDRVEGLGFSLLSLLDGCSMGFPGCEVIPCPHESDKAYHISEGENYYPDPPNLDNVKTVHGDSMLHELYYGFGKELGYISSKKRNDG